MRKGGESAEDAGQKLTDPALQDVQRCVKLNAAAEIQKGEKNQFELKKKCKANAFRAVKIFIRMVLTTSFGALWQLIRSLPS